MDSLFTSRELKKMQLLDKKERNQNNEENPNLDEETKRKILSRYESMMYDDDEIDEDYVASVYNPNEDVIEGETEVPGADVEQTPDGQEKSEGGTKKKEKENEQKNDRKDGQKNGQKSGQNKEKKGDGKKEQKGNQKKSDEKKTANAVKNNTKESGKSQNGEGKTTGPKSAEGKKDNKENKENKENNEKEKKIMKNGIKEKRYEKSIQRNKLNHHRKERDDKKRGYY